VKRDKQVTPDAFRKIALIHQIFITEGEQVAPVGPLGGGGETQEEARREIVDDPAIGGGGGVMEFVNHNVVEGFAFELVEVPSATQRLSQAKEHVSVVVLLLPGVKPEVSLGTNLSKSLLCLVEDLLSMGDEKYTPVLWAVRIEGGKPGLTEASRKHNKTRSIPVGPGTDECFEGFLLNRVRRNGG